VTSEGSKPLRADAVRNSEKILRAAREVFAERGPNAPLEDIARRAGVGIATLYRHFPDKAGLVRGALDQSFSEGLGPVIEQALRDDDPRRGLANVIESAMSLLAQDYNTMAAGRNAGASTTESSARFFEALTPLLHRGQQAGLIRDDLVLDDIRRFMTMLVSVFWTLDPREGGWRRYVVLLLDVLSPGTASPLPPAVPIRLREPGE
jgi:AcrR family transcriptional regulator